MANKNPNKATEVAAQKRHDIAVTQKRIDEVKDAISAMAVAGNVKALEELGKELSSLEVSMRVLKQTKTQAQKNERARIEKFCQEWDAAHPNAPDPTAPVTAENIEWEETKTEAERVAEMSPEQRKEYEAYVFIETAGMTCADNLARQMDRLRRLEFDLKDAESREVVRRVHDTAEDIVRNVKLREGNIKRLKEDVARQRARVSSLQATLEEWYEKKRSFVWRHNR